jgi:hypothetical protein
MEKRGAIFWEEVRLDYLEHKLEIPIGLFSLKVKFIITMKVY